MRCISFILVLLLLMPQTGWAEDLTLQKERELGEKALREVLKQVELATDPDCVSYLREVGAKLIKKLDDPRFDIKFYLAKKGEMNAFALPAGNIFVFRGIIEKMETEGELAGVMAHEMAHVHYRHIAERMRQSGPLSVAAMAGMLAGVLLGALAGAPELGQAVAIGAMAGAQGAAMAFSREDELEADYFGYKLMTSCGYNGEDMARTFLRLWKMQRTMYATPPPYLTTHPTSPKRMEAIQNMAYRDHLTAKPQDNHRFLRVRTRLTALYENEDAAGSRFRNELRQNPRDPYALYGMGLVSLRTGDYRMALKSMHRLAGIWTDDSSITRDMGICYLHLGQQQKAQELLNEALNSNPGDQQTLLALGQSLTQENHLDEAIFTLRRLLNKNPDLPQAHYDLGVALGKSGRTAEASLHLGLAFKGRKNLKMARYHLDQAARTLGDQPKLQNQAIKLLNEMDEEKKKREGKKKKPEESKP